MTGLKHAFRSLAIFNFRLWAAGSIFSYVGTWMQRVAQTWLVLAQLTDNNATAVGVLTALQYGPLFLLLPWTGFAADRFDRRKLLIATQAAMGALALALGLLIVSDAVRLWHVYVFAVLLGCVSAFDSPASNGFAADLVGETHLSNAVALNSTLFNAARLIGPAVAGVLIAALGTGWAFLINAGSFVAVIGALCLIRANELHRASALEAPSAGLDGIRYVWARPRLLTVMLMLFLIGTFALNFPLFISAMTVKVFHVGADRYGLAMSIMAVGSIAGAMFSAVPLRPGIAHLVAASALLGLGFALAALAPAYWPFTAALVLMGAAAVTMTTLTNSVMQLHTEPFMRGRVLALRTAVAVGATPLGAPLLGWIADGPGPRWALALGGGASIVAMLVGLEGHHRGSPLAPILLRATGPKTRCDGPDLTP